MSSEAILTFLRENRSRSKFRFRHGRKKYEAKQETDIEVDVVVNSIRGANIQTPTTLTSNGMKEPTAAFVENTHVVFRITLYWVFMRILSLIFIDLQDSMNLSLPLISEEILGCIS